MSMADTNPTISVITLNTNGLKDRDCQNGSKNKTQYCVVCKKKSTLDIKKNIPC